jgi:hypothetical protein
VPDPLIDVPRQLATLSSDTELWLVDGFNVLHACILKGRERQHWWSAESQTRVLTWLEPFARRQRVCVVFDDKSHRDGARLRCDGSQFGGEVRFADSADDEIVSIVGAERSRYRICVVTADRALRDRALHAGAPQLMKPWAFADMLSASLDR